jgi:hypothetical protein
MTATIVMVVVVVAAAIVAIALLRRSSAAGAVALLPPEVPVTATAAMNAFTDPPAAQPGFAIAPRDPIAEAPAEPVSPPVVWTTLVTEDQSVLDADARIRLLADLGIVRAPWCVPILIRACDEERDPNVRRAALEALSGFRNSPEARAALDRAAASGSAASNGAHAG